MGHTTMSTLSNKKAGERSTSMQINWVRSVIMVVVILVVLIYFFSDVGKGMEESRQKKCRDLLESRHAVNQVELIGPGDPYIGTAITGTTWFYVSPSCGKMYKDPCKDVPDCQTRIRESIEECKKMQDAEPETSRPCLTDLQINISTLPPGSTSLCKGDPGVCGTGPNCGSTGIANGIVDYKDCPQQGDSLLMKYDSSSITVVCQGTCK